MLQDCIKGHFLHAFGETWYIEKSAENEKVLEELWPAYYEFDEGHFSETSVDFEVPDVDTTHIHITMKKSGHKYHIQVDEPACICSTIYRIQTIKGEEVEEVWHQA